MSREKILSKIPVPRLLGRAPNLRSLADEFWEPTGEWSEAVY
jgi:hypothetical protein